MTKAADIKNRRILRAWLQTRPRENAVVIAHRSALRVFPLLGAAMNADWARERDLTALPILRASVVSAVGSHLPTANIQATFTSDESSFASSTVAYYAAVAALESAFAATLAVEAATHAAALAADSAADAAAYTSASAVVAAWRGVRSDAQALETEEPVARLPLWDGDPPEWFDLAMSEMIQVWERDPPQRWEFWRRWFDAAVAGQPLDPPIAVGHRSRFGRRNMERSGRNCCADY